MKFEDIFYLDYGMKAADIKNVDYLLWLKRIYISLQDFVYRIRWWRGGRNKPRLFFPQQNIKISYLIQKLKHDFDIYDKYSGPCRWRTCWFKELANIYYNKDEEKLIKRCNTIAIWFKKMGFNAVILLNDLHPEERLVIDAAKMVGIPTICIQHGFLTGGKDDIGLGRYSDYFLTWGDWIKEDYIKNGYGKNCNIIAMGFPFVIQQVGIIYNKTILFISNGRLDKELEHTIFRLNELCKSSGLRFGFKTHPRGMEKGLENLKRNSIEVIENLGDKTLDVFRSWDIICGLESSMLIEAYLAKKPCFQLAVDQKSEIDFEKIGICPKLGLNEVGKYLGAYLEDELELSKTSKYVFLNDNYYLAINNFLKSIIKD